MSVSSKTPSEAAKSINGFDEIAIAAHFGARLTTLQEDAYSFLRALVFVDKRRDGLKDNEAYKAAMEVTIGELGEYFAAEDFVEDDQGEAHSA